MKRRTFMKSVATATGAVAVGANARAGEFTGKIKTALKYNMIAGEYSVEDKVRIAKDAGFAGIEPSVGEKFEPAEFKRACDKIGLPIHGVVNGSVNNIKGAIDRAIFYGSSSVLLVAGRVNEKMPYEENYRTTQATIRAAIPYAEEKNIHLLIENVWNNFLLSPLEMRDYIDELESDHVKVYFDIGNVVRFAWPEHWIPVLGHRVHKLDVKEYSRKKQNDEGLWKGFNVEIGDGSIDWAAVRRELKAINYTGWATAEVGAGGPERLADIAQRMDRVLDLA